MKTAIDKEQDFLAVTDNKGLVGVYSLKSGTKNLLLTDF